MATIAEALDLALRHHRAGKLPQAEQLYRQILQVDAVNADALYLLGVLAHQVGQHAQALGYLQHAVQLAPRQASIHSSLGLVYQSLRQLDEAIACYRQALNLQPDLVEVHNNLGAALRERGLLDEAIASFRQALHLRPDFFEAHNNLGAALRDRGLLDEAIASYRQALQLRPGSPEVSFNLGRALADQGRLDDAIASYRQTVRLRPDFFEAHNDLATALRKQGRLDEAIACYREALNLLPDRAETQNDLGIALRQHGQRDEAVACYRAALRLRPDFPEAQNNLGNALQEQGQLDEAIACYQEALRLRPDYVEAHNNLENAFREQGRLEEAVASLRQALRLRPDQAETHQKLGSVLREQGKLEEAAASLLQALALQPDNAEAQGTLGSILREQGKIEEALPSLRQALHLKPDYADAHYNLGIALAAQGKMGEAEEHLRESLRLRPSPTVRLVHALLLPIIYQSSAEVRARRRQFVDNVRQLRQEDFTLDLANQPAPTPFLLVYQGGDDRDLLREVTQLYAVPADPPRPPRQVRQGGKIKVGFISHYFWKHTVAHLMRGLIAQLARDAFHLTVLSVGSYQDAYARLIQQQSDVHLEVPAHLPAARRLIVEQDLDVLIYTDIGMDPVTYALAFSRLAPVQCVAWGHGVTTAIPTLDYFLSGELLETEDGDRHYTERLVRLPNLGVYYYRPPLPASPRDRAYFGLPEDGHLYACLQTLFKFHPDFDALLAGILRRDPRGTLVLIQGKFASWEELLRQRFAVTLPDVMERIRFLPLLANEDYLNLMALADVLLDPLYNVGGNSSFEGFAVGTPIVTLPSRHLGGRLTRALYAQMGIWDCVANSAEEYVDKAVRLGTDADYRAALRDKIRAASDVLYENPAGVRGLERFLQHAVAGR